MHNITITSNSRNFSALFGKFSSYQQALEYVQEKLNNKEIYTEVINQDTFYTKYIVMHMDEPFSHYLCGGSNGAFLTFTITDWQVGNVVVESTIGEC